MLSSFMISQSGAQARAIWYILKTAVCPVAGSTFSGSCFAVVGAGVFEQAVRIASRAIAGKMDSFNICTCVPILAMGARVRHAVHIRQRNFWWDNVGSQRRWHGLEDLGEGNRNGGSRRFTDQIRRATCRKSVDLGGRR